MDVCNILLRHEHRSGYTAIGKLWPLNYECSSVRVLRELFCHVKGNLFPVRTLILRAGNGMVKRRDADPANRSRIEHDIRSHVFSTYVRVSYNKCVYFHVRYVEYLDCEVFYAISLTFYIPRFNYR